MTVKPELSYPVQENVLKEFVQACFIKASGPDIESNACISATQYKNFDNQLPWQPVHACPCVIDLCNDGYDVTLICCLDKTTLTDDHTQSVMKIKWKCNLL